MKTYIKDMTQGRPAGLLLSFMLPMVVGNVFQQMYNLVDSMIVGNMWAQMPLRLWGPQAL